MRATLMIITVTGLVVLLSAAEARYYKKINNDHVAYDLRSKRQSHPDTTIARIPQIPFADPANNEASPGVVPSDAVPAPAEYLTPPAPDSSQLTPQQPPPPTDKWNLAPRLAPNLGFDAGDVLVPPPSDQAFQYDTLRLFTLLPQSSQPAGESEGFGPAEQESAADSRTPFIDSYHPQWTPPAEDADASSSASNKPVHTYSFVKTDPHGHFKWGVHIGQ